MKELRDRASFRLACWSVAAIGACALVPADGTAATRAPTRGDPQTPRSASVSFDVRHPGTTVPGDFLGLSFEVKSLPQLATFAGQGNLVGLLRSLGRGVLRFGGVTADTQVAWSDDGSSQPSWATTIVSPADLQGVAALAAQSGWRVLLSVNLGHYDPQAAARETAVAQAALGSALAGVEFGNEPDSWASDSLRTPPWGFEPYRAQVDAYRAAIGAAAPGVALAGPDVSSGVRHLPWLNAEAVVEQPSLLTAHYYPLSWCAGYVPTLDDLLSPGIHRAETRVLASMQAIAAQYAIPLRVAETNNISCGGEPGYSDTFATALWAVDYLARAMSAGVAGVNLHGNIGNPLGYTPLAANSLADLASGQLTAQPEWYALLFARQLIGDRPLPTSLADSGRNLTAAAFSGSGGALHVVLTDQDPEGARGAVIGVQAPAGYAAATALALAAPSRLATTGVTLGGVSVAPDGSWSPPRTLPLQRIRHGQLRLALAPDSATLLTLYPARRPATPRAGLAP